KNSRLIGVVSRNTAMVNFTCSAHTSARQCGRFGWSANPYVKRQAMIRTVLIVALVAVGGCIPAIPATRKTRTEDPNKVIVENWLHRHLNDPSDLEIVEWGKFEQVAIIEGTVDMRDFKGPRFTKVDSGPFAGSSTANPEWLAEHERRKEKLPHHPGILG